MNVFMSIPYLSKEEKRKRQVSDDCSIFYARYFSILMPGDDLDRSEKIYHK